VGGDGHNTGKGSNSDRLEANQMLAPSSDCSDQLTYSVAADQKKQDEQFIVIV